MCHVVRSDASVLRFTGSADALCNFDSWSRTKPDGANGKYACGGAEGAEMTGCGMTGPAALATVGRVLGAVPAGVAKENAATHRPRRSHYCRCSTAFQDPAKEPARGVRNLPRGGCDGKREPQAFRWDGPPCPLAGFFLTNGHSPASAAVRSSTRTVLPHHSPTFKRRDLLKTASRATRWL